MTGKEYRGRKDNVKESWQKSYSEDRHRTTHEDNKFLYYIRHCTLSTYGGPYLSEASRRECHKS